MRRPSQKSPFHRCTGATRAGLIAAGCAAALIAAPAAALAEGPSVRTSDEASESGLQGVLTAPLRDVNLMRDKVPKALKTAKAAPYVEPQDATCAELAEMIAPLDAALGPDVGDGVEAEKNGVGALVFGAMADVTRDVIPFRGVVRRITGASKHDEKVREARQAGHLRRAYLKGFASAKGCYGPPEQQVAAAEPAPPVIAPPPPVAVAELTPPPAPPAGSQPAPVAVADLAPRAAPRVKVSDPAEPPTRQVAASSPVFNLPESWRAELEADGY